MKGASFSPPITDKKNRHEKVAVIDIGIVVIYAIVQNLRDAESKPFWLDELLTMIVPREPSVSAIWKTLAGVKDGRPQRRESQCS